MDGCNYEDSARERSHKKQVLPTPQPAGEVELGRASLLAVRKRASPPLLSNTLTRSQYISVTNILKNITAINCS